MDTLIPPREDRAVGPLSPLSHPHRRGHGHPASRCRRRGFSLLELLIAMAIIVLMASFMLFAGVAVWKFVHRVLDLASN